MQFPNEARFGNFITRVNAILQGYSAFRHGGNCRFVDNDHHAVIAVYRQESEVNATGFLIVCNFDIQASQDISIDPGSFAGKWQACFVYRPVKR
ncbi:MAG: hypothetical protein HC830_08415 [Bacteroidetes bacterium]|nr:hypothetical protein [Bacteroidota bacterium]